jgi:flagellar biosynthetic protein FliQ
MNQTEVIELGREAVYVMLKVSAPVLLAALGIGIVIALFQALTQMQEMTLTFVPKILVVMVALIVLAPFMLNALSAFTFELTDRIVAGG